MSQSPSPKKRKTSSDEDLVVIQWDAVAKVFERETTSLAKSMGTFLPTASIAEFSFKQIMKTIQEKAPRIWAILSGALEKSEGQKIKNNERRDEFLTFHLSAFAKFRNQRANRLSLFVGLFLLSKGTPEIVGLLFFLSIQLSRSSKPSYSRFRCLLSINASATATPRPRSSSGSKSARAIGSLNFACGAQTRRC